MAQVLSDTAASKVWRIRPQHAAPAFAARTLLVAVALLGGVIALAFAWFGAWMVLPFTGLEVLALWWALRHIARSTDDFEEVRLHSDRLQVSARIAGRGVEASFHPYWVQVAFVPAAPAPRLVVRSHGREVEIGRLLGPEAKSALARDLKARLEALRAPAAPHDHPHPALGKEDS